MTSLHCHTHTRTVLIQIVSCVSPVPEKKRPEEVLLIRVDIKFIGMLLIA